MPRCRVFALLALPMLVLGAEAVASEEEPGWQLAVHGGWWDVGLDTTTPGGFFVGAGVPWVPLLPVLAYSGQEGVVALDSRLGYAHALSTRTSLRAQLLTAWVYDWGDPCGDGCNEHTHRLFFLPGVGLRHRFGDRSGWMMGADVPLVLLQVHHGDEPDDPGWRRKNTPPWVGVAFSQVYVGYEWGL